MGIATFRPINAAIDIAIIGPNIQARGTLKYSAIIALGVEIKNTNKNSDDINDRFFISYHGIRESSFTINIYNRANEVVYSTTNIYFLNL